MKLFTLYQGKFVIDDRNPKGKEGGPNTKESAYHDRSNKGQADEKGGYGKTGISENHAVSCAVT